MHFNKTPNLTFDKRKINNQNMKEIFLTSFLNKMSFYSKHFFTLL